MEKPHDRTIVNNAGELLAALKRKDSYILVPQAFSQEFLENTQLPLSETERMGFELGFRGAGGLTASPFFHLINWLSRDSKEQKQIDSRIRSYVVKKQDDDILLYLRQLDY